MRGGSGGSGFNCHLGCGEGSGLNFHFDIIQLGIRSFRSLDKIIFFPGLRQMFHGGKREEKKYLDSPLSGLKVIKLFSCSTQLNMKFSLLINMKMPTIVGIFIFISSEIFMLSYV